MRTPTLDVRVQLLLGLNTYLLCSIVILRALLFVENRLRGGREHCGALNVGEWRVVGWFRKSYLGSAKIGSFFCQDFNRSNDHDTFWHVVSTGYLHILFLWAIAVSNFCPLEIYRNFSLLLSTITCTVSSHADNHFYEYIHLFQILYSMKYFLHKFFIFIRTMAYGDRNYWKIIFGYRLCENYWVTYCTHITSHANWVDEIVDVMISTKKINKN